MPSLSASGTLYWLGCATVTFAYGLKVWTTPWDTSARASINESGSRMYSVVRVRSTQKLPMVSADRRARPRMNAATVAIPAAAETKF